MKGSEILQFNPTQAISSSSNMTSEGDPKPKLSTIHDVFVCSHIVDNGPFQGCWEVMDRDTGDFHYLKIIEKALLDTSQKQSQFSSEISLISSFSHHLVPSLVAFFNDQDNFYVVFEKPPQMSLLDRINTIGRFNETQLRNFIATFEEIATYFLTEINITNYLFYYKTIYVNEDGSISKLYPLLSTRSFLINDTELDLARTKSPEEITLKGTDQPDAKRYITFSYNVKCISWFLGVTSYFAAVGCFPFNGITVESTYNSILKTHPVYPGYLSKEFIDLLKKLLIKNPRMRLLIDKIHTHPFCNVDNIFSSKAIPSSKSVHRSHSLYQQPISQTFEVKPMISNLQLNNFSFPEEPDEDIEFSYQSTDDDDRGHLNSLNSIPKPAPKFRTRDKSLAHSFSINSEFINETQNKLYKNTTANSSTPTSTNSDESSSNLFLNCESIRIGSEPKNRNPLLVPDDSYDIPKPKYNSNSQNSLKKSMSLKKLPSCETMSLKQPHRVKINSSSNNFFEQSQAQRLPLKQSMSDRISLTPKRYVSSLHHFKSNMIHQPALDDTNQ